MAGKSDPAGQKESSTSIAEQMKAEIEELTKYRAKLEGDMKASLKELAKSEDLVQMVSALAGADGFGEAVANERKAVEDQRDKVLQAAREDIKKLISSRSGSAGGSSSAGSAGSKSTSGAASAKGVSGGAASDAKTSDSGDSNFVEVEDALEKYRRWPAELQESVEELQKFRDETVDKAKENLLTLMDSGDPNHIAEQLQQFDMYGASVHVEVAAVNKRLDALMKQAKQEIDTLLKIDRDSAPSMQEIDALTLKYENYPRAAMQDSMDKLRSSRVLLISSLRDTVSTLIKVRY
eukprot:SAG11_NODE_301_length_11038_cov_2.312826_8_plen_293_part_00